MAYWYSLFSKTLTSHPGFRKSFSLYISVVLFVRRGKTKSISTIRVFCFKTVCNQNEANKWSLLKCLSSFILDVGILHIPNTDTLLELFTKSNFWSPSRSVHLSLSFCSLPVLEFQSGVTEKLQWNLYCVLSNYTLVVAHKLLAYLPPQYFSWCFANMPGYSWDELPQMSLLNLQCYWLC